MRRRVSRSLLLACGLLALCAGAAAAEDEENFPVWEIRVLGNTRLAVREIEAAVYPHTGPDRTLKDIEAARDALVQRYRDLGFATVLVDIPEQSVDKGIVRLQVTEGRLDRLRVTGARYYSRRRLVAALPEARPGNVPNLPALQGQLAALAQLSPDREVTPLLRAGRMPGTVDMELQVKDRLPLHASVEVNDRYSADTSRTRLSASLAYDNLFQVGHSLSLQYQTAPAEPGEVQVLGLSYVARSLESRNLLALYAIDSDSDVAAIGTLSVIGKGHIFGGRYIVPLQLAPDFNDSVTLGADYKAFRETVRVDPQTTDSTPLSYLVFNLGYGANWRRERLDTGFTLGGRFGLRGLGNSDSEFTYKRYRARPNFAVFTGSGQGQYRITPWLEFTAKAGLQYAPRPVVSNEQFSLGGVDTVRGYLETETLVDSGIAGALELAAPLWHRNSGALAGYGFVDGGAGSVNDPLPGQSHSISLASAGAGLRLDWGKWLNARVDWAYPLKDGTRIEQGESRLEFSVRTEF